jgi:aspartate kinase
VARERSTIPVSSETSASGARPIVVMKFGGSSVADVEKIGRVADKVAAAKRRGDDVVVVVSAMGKTTDGLLALAQSASAVGATRPEPPRRELDMLVSTGERVSMALLSIAMHARGIPAISFTGSQSGILTNDRHFDARIIEVRPHRIDDELARGHVVIVAGYQGMSYRREITTLGRGGSDTTAVALAAALRADRCEIYSDVDGVYSADPRVVPDARHLPELDHGMLQEMAEGGAKVVCAQAVEWARRRGIVVHARSTFDDRRETIVRPTTEGAAVAARAVVCESKLLYVSWSSIQAMDALRAVGALGLAYRDLTLGATSGSMIVPLLNVPNASEARRAIAAALPRAELREDVASLAVVGDGLASSGEALARFVDALARAGIEPLALHAGPLRISAVVSNAGLDAGQRALHEALVAQRA